MDDATSSLRPSTERLNAFSDGVMAIVVTVLVLDIRVPERLSMSAILDFLLDIERDMLIYAATFWLVAIYWLTHHLITSYVRFVDHRLLLRNLLFLFSISLLPFFTKLKNAYPASMIAAQGFGINHLACGLSLLGVWRYVCRRPELRSRDVSPGIQRHLQIGIGVGCGIALAASSVSHLHERFGPYLLPLIPVTYAVMLMRSSVLGKPPAPPEHRP